MAKPKTLAGGAFAVVAKKSMMRGGRSWTAGVHVFDTEEKLAELGTAEQIDTMLKTLALYPDDFEVKKAEPAKEPE
jgi:hypothetical protein